jgi:hypothetical protein
LQQGDLLRITEDIRNVLLQCHPYYANKPDYAFLMVLTQSCNLSRRDGECKARYITLAAVRPIKTLIERELEKHQWSSIEKVNKLCSDDRRHHVKDFLNKLLNNNLPEYFYLAEDPELEINRPHVAFLTLSVAVKKEHYEKCVVARIAQLTEIFQAKLGWLVGDIYSRIGTPDWVPEHKTQPEFDAFLEKQLNEMSLWVSRNCLEQLKMEQQRRRKERKDKKYSIPQDEVLQLIGEFASEQESRKKRVVELLVKQTSSTIKGIQEDELRTLEQRLMNNEELERLVP